MKEIKGLANILLIFIMIICFFSSIVLCFYFKVLNINFVEKELENSMYYENLANEIQEKIYEYVVSSGIDEYIFENIVTKEDIQKATRIILENILENKNDEIDVLFISNNLYNALENDSNYKDLISSNKTQIDELVKHIQNDYKRDILYHNYSSYSQKLININKKLEVIKNVCLTISIICIILEIFINLNSINVIFSNIAIAILSTGMIFIVLRLYFLSKINISNISIQTDAFSAFLTNILTNITNSILTISIVMLVLRFILLIISSILYTKKYATTIMLKKEMKEKAKKIK